MAASSAKKDRSRPSNLSSLRKLSLFLAAVVLCLPLTALAQGRNLLPNASFESAPIAGASARSVYPWSSRAWSGKAEAKWTAENPGRQDKHCVSIQSTAGADAAWTAHVTVKPQTRYELSGWIKTQDIRGAKGALFNVQGVADSATQAITGTTDWTQVSVVFNSGNKTRLEVNCLFGGWGLSTGQAWYDDIVLRQAETEHAPVADIPKPAKPSPNGIPGTLRARDGLQAVPIMARDKMPFPILGVGVANDGTVYVTETIRQMREEISLIQSPFLHETCMSLTSVDAKKDWLTTHFSQRISRSQRISDFNKDGKIDVADLAVRSEKIYTLQDLDNDGIFDHAQLFAEGFKDTITGIAHSVAPIDGSVYATIVPDVWRLTDTDGDGVADKRTSIAHGFAPHIGYGNHDVHSVIRGYDGKLYWSMGDRGVHIENHAGQTISNPHSGCILRSNLDGSELEVFAYGLRNCQYIDFDDYGNLFSIDHDADFPGERERLVYLLEGSDSGWRMYLQYRTNSLVKAARNDLYNPWLDERLWVPFHDGQPSHILPPIENSWNAPAAFSFQPGNALGGKYSGCFLLGGKGEIRAFKMIQDGATFKREGQDVIVSGLRNQVLTSTFGTDGRLYFTLWKPDGSRSALWALETEVPDPVAQEIHALLNGGMDEKPVNQLTELLAHSDRRVRQGAQFALVKRQRPDAMRSIAVDRTMDVIPRIHCLWGLGQLRHKDPSLIEELYTNTNPEIRAQLARWAGDMKFDPRNRIPLLLSDPSDRVRMMAAIACGKLSSSSASEPLCGMIEIADNKKPTLRHAGVMGLAGAATAAELHKLCKHPSESVRVAAVQALRRTGGHRQLISFLTDESAQVVADTVRAIYDEATPTSVAATPQTLPAVAALLAPNRSLAINVRAIAANRRIASIDAARRIANILDLPDVDDRVRIEALYALESWTEGSALDPVDGRYFPVSAGDPSALKAVVGMPIWRLTQETNPAVSERAIALLKRIPPSPEELERVTALTLDRQRPNGIRIGWLQWLRAQAPEQFEAAAIRLLADPLPALRTAAAGALGDARLGTDALDAYVIRSLETSRDVPERQQAISIIPRLQNGTRILSDLLDSLIAGSLAPEIQLDVIAAATFVAKDHPGISGKLKHYHSMLEKSDPLSRYGAALSGGDIARGKNVFHTNALAQCSKCHALNLADKQVGPSLEGIGQRKERAYLLQSIVDPQAVIVPGYGFIVITLTDGSTVSGTLLSEAKTDITVQLPNGETTTIKQSTIRSSTEPVGTMPDLTSVLTPHQIRDLVAYLESL